MSNSAGSPPAPGAALDVHVRAPELFSFPDLEAEGRARAQGLFPDSPISVADTQRERLREHARHIVYGRIPDTAPISDHELKLLTDEFRHTHDTVLPQAKHEERVRQGEYEAIATQLNQLGEPPQAPKKVGFYAIASLFGIVFGLFASTTLSAIIAAVFGLNVSQSRAPILEGGAFIGILVGLIVGLPVVVLGRYALGGRNWAIRHGPVALGAFLAIGLGGFRLLHTDPNTGEVSVGVSAIGIALLFIELAILCGVEFVNQVYLNAWERYEDGSREHKRLERIKAQEHTEWQTDKREREQVEAELDGIKGELNAAHQRNHEWRRDHANRDAFVNQVATHLLNGFEQALNEKRLGSM